MTTKWRLIGLSAMVAAVMSASPAFAVDPEKSKDLADIQKQLDRIQISLDRDLKELREDVEFTKRVRVSGLENDVRALKQELLRMADEIERLRTSSTSSRTSYYAGPSGPTGAIRLRNTHLTSVTFLINDRLYEVPSGGEITLNNQPAGEFTYEVIGVQPRLRRTLVANRTFYIDVFPR
jgi:predicted RNase H-like nuclease (RuvC/YqgF family)